MDRLSSCYFCGDATDATLDEFPVVPDVLEPTAESQTTVVLCGDCRRKLDAVVERIVDAAEDSGSGASAGDGRRTRSRTGGDSSPADESDSDDVEATLAGGEDVLRSVDDGTDQSSDDEGDGPTSAGEADSGLSNLSPDEPDGEADSAGADSTGSSDDEDPVESSADGDGDDEPSLTRLEYNKVMRLLQNRELPVERQGFVNVAANAYELDPRECERVLDVAIENGLIGEEDGQLVEPED